MLSLRRGEKEEKRKPDLPLSKSAWGGKNLFYLTTLRSHSIAEESQGLPKCWDYRPPHPSRF